MKPEFKQLARFVRSGTIAALLALSAIETARSATRTWTGGGADNNWMTPANWGGSAPAAGDALVFPGGPTVDATSLNNTNNFAGSTVFGSITFSGTNYMLQGGTVVLTNGIHHQSGATNTVALGLAVAGDQTFECTVSSGQLNLTGTSLGFNGDNLTNNTIGRIHISNGLTGTGQLVKNGTGTLRLQGTTGSASVGAAITVQDGLLELGKIATVTAIPGTLTIGDAIGAANSAIVRLLAADQIANTSAITIANEGLLDLNGNSETIGPLTLAGGEITTGAGVLTLGGDVTVNTPPGPPVSGHLSLGSVTRTFNLAGASLSIVADISGSGGLIKSGPFDLTLHGSNSFSGVAIVEAGVLYIDHDSSLGSTAAGTVVQNGATLGILSAAVGLEPLTLDSTNTSLGALFAFAGSNFWAGPITLARDTTIRADSAITLQLGGAIGGTGSLSKIGPGTLIFSGTNANSYDGTTTVARGSLLLAKADGTNAVPGDLIIGDGVGGANADVVQLLADSQIRDSSAVTITSSGLLDTSVGAGFVEVVGPLSGQGNLQIGTGIFSVGFVGQDVTFDGVIGGSGTLILNGIGTWTLNGSNTYSGNFTLNSSAAINGTLPASFISVNGSLSGTGTVGRVRINAGATLSPGLSPGRLTSSNISFVVSSKFRVELNGTNAGAGYDQLKVNGAVSNLASATLIASLGFGSAISNVFTIIDNDGSDAITNTFFGLPEGATVNISGTPFRISYVGGTGNDVTLTQLTATQQLLLKIQPNAATNVVLSWPTNFVGFMLEASTNLNTNLWAAVLPAPSISGTNNVVTNAATGLERYYRLHSP
jgi:autotransporter-associated beta strand protein